MEVDMKKYLLLLIFLAAVLATPAGVQGGGIWVTATPTVTSTPYMVYWTWTPTATATPTPTNTPTPQPYPDLLACERPYTEDSVWNAPIDWGTAKIHPNSTEMMNDFLKGRGFMGAATEYYSANIYFVTNDTPLVPVKVKNSFRDAIDDVKVIYSAPGATIMMPIPDNAEPSPGTDGQLAVINVGTGEEWGVRVAYKDPYQNKWYASGAYRYHIANSGVPPNGFGQRGAGIGQLAGKIFPCEVERGYIDHAVTLAFDHPCSQETCASRGWPYYIPPFRKSDGIGTDDYDFPEGARVVIRPEITQTQIESVCKTAGCIVWVKAMQEYGGYVVDNGKAKTFAQGQLSADWGEEWNKFMLRDIPWDWYAILIW
jgi:hypothetical protein